MGALAIGVEDPGSGPGIAGRHGKVLLPATSCSSEAAAYLGGRSCFTGKGRMLHRKRGVPVPDQVHPARSGFGSEFSNENEFKTLLFPATRPP